MAISQYIKEIGRGPRGSKPLTREQAADLFGQLLDGNVTDLEIGAFCLAMRIKGETPEEMAGFLDAIHQRLPRLAAPQRPLVVLPSYNGARKLPNLTTLLALLLIANYDGATGSLHFMIPTAINVPMAWKPAIRFNTANSRKAMCAIGPMRLTLPRKSGSRHSITNGR